MSRVASSLNATELAKPDIQMSMAVDLAFPSGNLRLHDGPGPLTIGGNTYEGTGKVQILEKIEEGLEVIARPVQVLLSGVDASIISTVRTDKYQNKQVTIYLCLFNQTTGDLVDTPEVVWEGRMDVITIRLAKDEASILINCEHRLRREPRIARYTDQDQQIAYSGDRFFDLTPKINGFPPRWGTKGAQNDGRSLMTSPITPQQFLDAHL